MTKPVGSAHEALYNVEGLTKRTLSDHDSRETPKRRKRMAVNDVDLLIVADLKKSFLKVRSFGH